MGRVGERERERGRERVWVGIRRRSCSHRQAWPRVSGAACRTLWALQTIMPLTLPGLRRPVSRSTTRILVVTKTARELAYSCCRSVVVICAAEPMCAGISGVRPPGKWHI